MDLTKSGKMKTWITLTISKPMDGTIVVKDMTKTGTASQLKNVNPYTKNREVAFVWAEGVTTELFEKSMCVKSLKAESWIGISKVDFGAGDYTDMINRFQLLNCS